MIKFEFVQPGEFDDPYYNIVHDGKVRGDIAFIEDKNQWGLNSIDYWYNVKVIEDIAEKLNELNESTFNQRILGVF